MKKAIKVFLSMGLIISSLLFSACGGGSNNTTKAAIELDSRLDSNNIISVFVSVNAKETDVDCCGFQVGINYDSTKLERWGYAVCQYEMGWNCRSTQFDNQTCKFILDYKNNGNYRIPQGDKVALFRLDFKIKDGHKNETTYFTFSDTPKTKLIKYSNGFDTQDITITKQDLRDVALSKN